MDTESIATLLNAGGMTTAGGGINWAGIIANFIFSTIGFVAFIYGKKQKEYKVLGIGLVLMIYPYFVPNVALMYVIGAGLCALLYFWRD